MLHLEVLFPVLYCVEILLNNSFLINIKPDLRKNSNTLWVTSRQLEIFSIFVGVRIRLSEVNILEIVLDIIMFKNMSIIMIVQLST
jgi:hypothetical protein